MSEPFLKWPGGKRWLVQKYGALFPSHIDRLIEPFVGGGAVFFHLQPKKAILSDANPHLILAYKMVRERPRDVHIALARLHRQHSSKLYYKIRQARPRSEIGQAVRFLYLNRTCFNGIYRVNLKGQFNVPVGSKSLVIFPDGYLEEVAKLLQAADLVAADFERSVDRAEKGDFLYVDPPYTVMHNNNNFVKYNDILFSWADQERLADSVRRASNRGVRIFVSNADHLSVRALYRDIGCQHIVQRSSILAASPAARRPTTELAITNY